MRTARDELPPDIMKFWRLYQVVEERRRQGRTDYDFQLLDRALQVLTRSLELLERPVHPGWTSAAKDGVSSTNRQTSP
jgi:hypothetical protein